MRERDIALKKLSELSFSLIDTNLYLDAYPTSEEALRYYEKLGTEFDEAVGEYESKFGPLTAKSTDGRSWNWIKAPWPWETEV